MVNKQVEVFEDIEKKTTTVTRNCNNCSVRFIIKRLFVIQMN